MMKSEDTDKAYSMIKSMREYMKVFDENVYNNNVWDYELSISIQEMNIALYRMSKTLAKYKPHMCWCTKYEHACIPEPDGKGDCGLQFNECKCMQILYMKL